MDIEITLTLSAVAISALGWILFNTDSNECPGYIDLILKEKLDVIPVWSRYNANQFIKQQQGPFY